MKPETPQWPVLALRAGLAFIWLATGLGVLIPEYRRLGAASLEPLGLPPWVMIVTCLGEILLGLRVLLGRAATWLIALQFATILTFSLILSLTQPDLLLDPWGRLTKNLPLLVMLAVLWLVEREGWTPRAVWLLRGGMASLWLIEGLIHKMLLGQTTPLVAFLLPSFHLEVTRQTVALVGAIQTAVAVAACLPRGMAARFALRGQMVVLIAGPLLASFQEPLLWVHPFGPLTKNVPWLLGTLVVLWLTKEDRVHEP